MKVYKKNNNLILENEGIYFSLKDFDLNDVFKSKDIISKLQNKLSAGEYILTDPIKSNEELYPPVGVQEIWASGVTYFSSKLARQEEADPAGGGDFYARVYEADRPELFFKSMPYRAVGHLQNVNIRKDSRWNVPEPELTLAINAQGAIIGYTIGNDMSSRSIEGENPLYLPQAKTYDGSASLGPCILLTEKPISEHTKIIMNIRRRDKTVFSGETHLNMMKRKPEELVNWLFRECSFPNGCFLMTGTGIIPEPEFSLQPKDEICIRIEPIGTLINYVS